MKLLDDLQAEHVLIERVVGSLQTWVDRRTAGAAQAAEGAGYLRFFRRFAGDHHHTREETILFEALVRETDVPADRGPLLVVRQAHRDLGALLDALAPLLTAEHVAPELARLAARYGAGLLHHIDAESSVLFPESALRFKRATVRELPDRAPTPDELAAREEGERLVAANPPRDIPGILRGDGCVSCAAYGVTCDGVEREWFHELEWEEISQRSD